jgi:hypothetical protein
MMFNPFGTVSSKKIGLDEMGSIQCSGEGLPLIYPYEKRCLVGASDQSPKVLV